MPATPSHKVEIRRLDGTTHSAENGYLEMKDPTVVRREDGRYEMYCSLGTSTTQQWVVGRFEADHPRGPWQELPHAKIEDVEGAEVCAPAVMLSQKNGKPFYEMYVQTTCFSPNGVIAYATSDDGHVFKGSDQPAMTKEDLPDEYLKTIISLYDVGMSEFDMGDKTYECMVFSGYRSIGCGDVFMSLREKTYDNEAPKAWSRPEMILKQEDVPFHNKPGADNFEWGLEGVKVDRLADDAYLMTGVCFLDRPNEERGTRQRVFFAAAKSPEGPYVPMYTPIEPTAYPEGKGENGHPDTIDLGDTMGLLYQERAGEGMPWHFRYTEMKKDDLLAEVRTALQPAAKPAAKGGAPKP